MESGKYYVLGFGNNLIEGMTKEQILAAITQAVESHTIFDVDTGFVTTLKEQNANTGLKFWIGTTAQYNAIQEKDNDCFYILTDDTELEDIQDAIETLTGKVNAISELKGQYLLNLTSSSVPYSDSLSVALAGDHEIKDFNIVKVTATGAGEILCNVQVDDTDNVLIKGTGTASLMSTSGVTLVNVNLTCSKSENKITKNRSVAVTITSSSTTLSEQTITKIAGVY